MKIVSPTSQPDLGAPGALRCSRTPTPPTRRSPRSRGVSPPSVVVPLHVLSRLSARARRARRRSRRRRPGRGASASIDLAHPPRAAPGRTGGRRRAPGTRSSSSSATTSGAPAPLEVARIQRLMVGRRVGVRDETGGVPAAASSHTVPPARETARSAAASAAPKCSVCSQEDVAGAGDPRDGAGGSRAPRRCGGPAARRRPTPPRRRARSRERAPATTLPSVYHGRVGPRTRTGHVRPPGPTSRCAPGIGRPNHAGLRSTPGREYRRRGRGAGRTARRGGWPGQVRVRLRERRRDAPQARGEHHRPRDEAARPEDDLRPAPGEDPQAVRRRGARSPGRAELSRTGRARQAGDEEGVEREARLRHQPRLDAVWCPGERHGHSAVAERLRDRERRPHVAGCSPGRDHARELRRRGH